jgi:hypothetical protein
MSETTTGKCGCGALTFDDGNLYGKKYPWRPSGNPMPLLDDVQGIDSFCPHCGDRLNQDGSVTPTARLAAAMEAVEEHKLAVEPRALWTDAFVVFDGGGETFAEATPLAAVEAWVAAHGTEAKPSDPA